MCIKRLFKRKQYALLYKVEDYGLHEAFLQVLDDIDEEGAPIDEEDLRQRLAECIEAFDDRYEIPQAVADSILNKPTIFRRKRSAQVSVGECVITVEQQRISDTLKQRHNTKLHTCSQCGAPLKDGKCDYCGTEYN